MMVDILIIVIIIIIIIIIIIQRDQWRKNIIFR